MITTNQKAQLKQFLIRVLVISLSALIVSVNFKSFISAGDLFPGGFTGITRLIQRCALEFGGVELPFGPINLALNAVPAFISYKLVGKRFTLYSCLSIVLTSIFTDLVPALEITEDILLICVFGGIINGFALSLCLGVRVTSGGTDFIAIALSERKNVDAWNYIFCGNVVLLAIADGGKPFYDPETARRIAAMGIPCFACAPERLPELLERALKGQSLDGLAVKEKKPG